MTIDKKTPARELVRFETRNPVGNVDREKGIIYGVSIVSIGEAEGHGMYVDETMLEQVVAAGETQEPAGVKSRFDHPGACSRAIGTFTGRFRNFRRDGDHTRADLHLADVAAKSPDGNLRDYILDLAKEDPDAFAISIVFRKGEPEMMDAANKGKTGFPPPDDPYWLPHARLEALHHCDVVDEGAANKGLFGRPEYFAEQAEAWVREHPNVFGRMMGAYYEWKQKQEEEKMSEERVKELEAELGVATEAVETLTGKLGEATTTIEASTAELETATKDAKAEGSKAVLSMVKARLERYKDPKFVVETIEQTDEEVQEAYIAKLEKLATKDGADTLEFDPPGNEDEEKFEDKVSEKMEAGKKRGEAVSECAREFPKLHEDYITRTNAERNAE